MCYIYSSIICRTSIQGKVLKISVFGVSSFIVRNARVQEKSMHVISWFTRNVRSIYCAYL